MTEKWIGRVILIIPTLMLMYGIYWSFFSIGLPINKVFYQKVNAIPWYLHILVIPIDTLVFSFIATCLGFIVFYFIPIILFKIFKWALEVSFKARHEGDSSAPTD